MTFIDTCSDYKLICTVESTQKRGRDMKLIMLFILTTFFSMGHGLRTKKGVSEIIENMLECDARWRYYVPMGAQNLLEEVVYPKVLPDDACPGACTLVIQDDGYLSCAQCEAVSRKYDNCYVHGQLKIIEDRPVVGEDPLRALHSLPYGFFVSKSKIPEAGLGMFTSIDIPAMVQLGPYVGSRHDKLLDFESNLYTWQVTDEDGKVVLINALNVSHSNYLRYINTPNCREDANTMAVQYKSDVYYVTLKPIPAGSELTVWYGNEYGKYLGLDKLECNNHIVF